MTSHQQRERLQVARQTALEELLRRMSEDKRMVPDPRKRLRLLKEQAKLLLRERVKAA